MSYVHLRNDTTKINDSVNNNESKYIIKDSKFFKILLRIKFLVPIPNIINTPKGLTTLPFFLSYKRL